MAGRPLPRIALATAAAVALGLGTARAYLPGDADPTFNGGQPLVFNFALSNPGSTLFLGSAVDGQGRILVTGSTTDEDGRGAVLLVRVTPSGALDPSFGSGGTVIAQLGLGDPPYAPQSIGYDVGPRPGGGWLVLGAASVDGDPSVFSRGGLVTAFDDDGTIDIGYGTGGSARATPSTTAALSAVGGAVGADGTAWVVGNVTVQQPAFDARLSLSKVTPAGLLDSSFGNVGPGHFVGGFAEGTFQSTGAGAAAVTPAGVLVCGTTTDPDNGGQLLVLRLTPNGTLDGGFGGGTGAFLRQVADPTTPFAESQGGIVAVGPDNEIYAAGRAEDANGRFGMSITRLTPAGTLDGTFGNAGTRLLQVSTDPGGDSGVGGLIVQPDGKPVAVGNVQGAMAAAPKGVVVRFDVGGALDPSFGSNGVVLLDYTPETHASRVTLSPDGRSAIVTGSTYPAGQRGHGFVTRILLAPLTTTTTLPGSAGCAAPPSLDGARCRLANLGAAIAAVPPGKIATRLAALATQADGRLAKAATATGKALRKRLRKARKPLRALVRQLESQAAENGIGAEQRADLAARTDALVSEIQALAGAA